MEQYYKLKIAGLERDLKICPVSDTLDIASFIMFGDVEMTIKCAEELLHRCPDFDILLTAEAKSIPLAYEMARQSGKSYVPVRKGKKVYMT
ncbi:MAG: adenine phosphoribosyltransferase, partial [Ruthenibacterium sp.]